MLNISKDEPVGKKSGLAEQRTLAGTGRKKELITSGKRGRKIRNYMDAVKSCKGKTRRVKAWLERNLATDASAFGYLYLID